MEKNDTDEIPYDDVIRVYGLSQQAYEMFTDATKEYHVYMNRCIWLQEHKPGCFAAREKKSQWRMLQQKCERRKVTAERGHDYWFGMHHLYCNQTSELSAKYIAQQEQK